MSHELEVAIRAAKEAGEILKENFDNINPVTIKEDKSFQTKIDKLSEKKIVSVINENFPNHSIIAEEGGLSKKNSEYTWLIDPLDGTTNYIIKIPFFVISIALAKNDEVDLGVIYDPIHNQLFTAELGKGAYLNNSSIKV